MINEYFKLTVDGYDYDSDCYREYTYNNKFDSESDLIEAANLIRSLPDEFTISYDGTNLEKEVSLLLYIDSGVIFPRTLKLYKCEYKEEDYYGR